MSSVLFVAGVLVLFLDTTAEDLPFHVRCAGCGRGREGAASYFLGGGRTSDFREFWNPVTNAARLFLALWVR